MRATQQPPTCSLLAKVGNIQIGIVGVGGVQQRNHGADDEKGNAKQHEHQCAHLAHAQPPLLAEAQDEQRRQNKTDGGRANGACNAQNDADVSDELVVARGGGWRKRRG